MNVRHVAGGLFIAAIALYGCGGSSTSDGTGGSGAQAGTGAFGGNGANGGNGGSGAGAGNGGSGAFAGSGGGSAAGGGGGGGSIPTKEIETACAQIEKLPCNVDNCIAEATGSAAEALKEGCAAEFKALLVCAISNPWHCVAGEDGPQLDAACTGAVEAYGACQPNCEGGGSSNGQCSIYCDGKRPFGAECQPASNGSLDCRCTDGPNAGKAFKVNASCDSNWADDAQAQCAQ